jgi:hypothetical protein
MMHPVLYGRDGMQHKAMDNVLGERPYQQTATKENGTNE